MVPEVLEGMLWLARLGLRCQVGTVRAGHGYADPSFRPASLPFVSLIGPLGIEVEPERDLPVQLDALVQLPGFVRGAPRAGEAVIAGSTLAVTFEADAVVEVTLAGGSFATPEGAAAICANIEASLRAAASAGTFRDLGGAAIGDPLRVAELEAIVCRYDAATSNVVLSSGRRGYVTSLAPSLVEIRGGTAAAALGFPVPTRGDPGRHVRQRTPAPKGFAVDVRLDLWAASQRDLGYLIDALVRAIPTRTRLVTRAALLAAEVAPGDTSLRLLASGEPTTSESWLHLEASDGLLDRVSDVPLEVEAAANVLEQATGVRLASNGVARKVLARVPVVPDPRRAAALAPNGVALTLGVRLLGSLLGQSGQLASLASGGENILALDYEIADADPGPDSVLVVDLTARATFVDGAGVSAVAEVTRRVPLALLSTGAALHVVAQSGSGVVSIAVDGAAQDLDEAAQSPAPLTVAPGRFAVGDDLVVVLGNPAGNPAAFELDHVHLYAVPVPALDPRLRRSANGADQFRPGDHIAVGTSERGLLPIGPTESFFVRSVSGDTIELDRAIGQRWRRRSLVHARDCFVQQREVKRRDDLMNRLYRYCVGFRVSTFLEQPATAIAGGLVVEPIVEVEARRGGRPAAGSPGVRTRILPDSVSGAVSRASQE